MKHSVLLLSAVLIFLPVTLTGQKPDGGSKKKITVSGTINDLNHKVVANAEIFVDSINTGVVTDAIGRYKIKVSRDAKNMIAVSTQYGYGQAEINGKTTVDITLNGDVKNLAAFISKNTKLPLKSKNPRPEKINTYTDIYQMIRQEVPGVVVSGRSIVVQQQNSFFGSSQPLFVVNGVRVNSIDHISPLEVKSIQLLKGSYAAIYGNEGANGVISITLKKGDEK